MFQSMGIAWSLQLNPILLPIPTYVDSQLKMFSQFRDKLPPGRWSATVRPRGQHMPGRASAVHQRVAADPP